MQTISGCFQAPVGRGQFGTCVNVINMHSKFTASVYFDLRTSILAANAKDGARRSRVTTALLAQTASLAVVMMNKIYPEEVVEDEGGSELVLVPRRAWRDLVSQATPLVEDEGGRELVLVGKSH